jgi:hypothetical protein
VAGTARRLVPVRPVRVVPARPVLVSVARARARGLVTTRSVRRRPAWAPRLAVPAWASATETVTVTEESAATAATAATVVRVPACRAGLALARPVPAAAVLAGRAFPAVRPVAAPTATAVRVPAVRVRVARVPAR